MFAKLFDYYFWFVQPPTILTPADLKFGYLFLAGLVVAIILGVARGLAPNKVNKRLIKKLFFLSLYFGLIGLVWLALRFENIPIFAQRFWVGLIILSSVVWLIFILKYWLVNFHKEKSQFERETLKSKYLPK